MLKRLKFQLKICLILQEVKNWVELSNLLIIKAIGIIMKNDIQKWRTLFESYNAWDDKRARRVQGIESKVILRWLLDLKLPKYEILEVGCGNGYMGSLISSYFLKHNIDFKYHFTDLLPECIETTKKNLSSFPNQSLLRFSVLDVLKIDEVLGVGSQKIILSTGYASAATYKDAVPVVARSLGHKGILICDFVNHLSPIVFWINPRRRIKYFLDAIKGKNAFKEQKKVFVMNNLHFIKSKIIRFRRNPIVAMFQKVD